MLITNGMVQIQVMNPNNTWRGVRNSNPSPFYYVAEMKRVKQQYPNAKVRVVDANGRLLDMIM